MQVQTCPCEKIVAQCMQMKAMLRGNIQCSLQEFSVAELAFTECAHHCIPLLSRWKLCADTIMDTCFLIFANSCITTKAMWVLQAVSYTGEGKPRMLPRLFCFMIILEGRTTSGPHNPAHKPCWTGVSSKSWPMVVLDNSIGLAGVVITPLQTS